MAPTRPETWATHRNGLQRLVDEVRSRGFDLRGPKVSGNSLTFGPIARLEDLPVGWEDEQSAGQFRLKQTRSERLFGVIHGAHSAKNHLYPSHHVLWRAKRYGNSFKLEPEADPPPKVALIGLRPCDLHAILIQDRVFRDRKFVDADYVARRNNTLLIVVNCTRVHETCFCASMDGGTRAGPGADIVITEIGRETLRYVLEARSDLGREVLAACDFSPATLAEQREVAQRCQDAEDEMTKGVERVGLTDLLYRNAENPYWEKVAKRCFACTCCTQVCPTCFCHNVVDRNSLSGDEAERERVWDSCFNEDFSYVHGGAVRHSVASRYRQWLTHKMAAWPEQFGTVGCVGCGRCITWCPAGIDLRDEVEAIRAHNIVPTTFSGATDNADFPPVPAS